MNTMGDRIHNKRIECGLTMEELGKKIGVQKSAVNKYEKGEVENIKRSTIAKMAEIFNVRPSWLMGYDDEKDITVTYEKEGAKPIKLQVDHVPVMGSTSKIAELYQLVLAIKPENMDLAIQILKTLV